jgi:KUP system potassium uptake protein
VTEAPSDGAADDPDVPRAPDGARLLTLSVAALGVVYGDIGTSPLYALRECFHGPHAIAATRGNILGVLSLVFWALIVVISGKYIRFVLRADNQGEGGILALTALATPIKVVSRSERWPLVLLGTFGAALLYGDGMITPAISVLSAVEGLDLATPVFTPYIVPITITVLIALFLIQSRGTGRVGLIFGPVTFAWFVMLAGLGAMQIAAHPSVLAAINPMYGAEFFLVNGVQGYLILGTVVLAITGGESLYVDLGHFGRRPIRAAWFSVVLPALLLNYFGQGALLITDVNAVSDPFFLLAPRWALYPVIGLATCATIIASQAVISGAFSITKQAVQFGFLPRLTMRHTSSTESGQIYMPAVNWALMIACILLVVGFRSSSNLAAAYGIAVIATMTITSSMLLVVARERWHWSLLKVIVVIGTFLAIDVAFLGANLVKIPHGGWFAILVGVSIFTVMTTWKRGRRAVATLLLRNAKPVDEFLRDIERNPPIRVPGTAVYMSGNSEGTPPALTHNLKHNQVLHEQIVLLTARTQQTPRVDPSERVEVIPLTNGFWRVIVNFGFMEEPNVQDALTNIDKSQLRIDPDRVTYFLGRETLIATNKVANMALWREKLFVTMSRNAMNATNYFCLPPDRVVELGAQLEI